LGLCVLGAGLVRGPLSRTGYVRAFGVPPARGMSAAGQVLACLDAGARGMVPRSIAPQRGVSTAWPSLLAAALTPMLRRRAWCTRSSRPGSWRPGPGRGAPPGGPGSSGAGRRTGPPGAAAAAPGAAAAWSSALAGRVPPGDL